MPASGRPNGSDSHVAARARQRLKLSAIGYASTRHGIDTDASLLRASIKLLRQMAIEFAQAVPGRHLKHRLDLYMQGDSEMLQSVAIAYASARHGVDADVGMAREGLALLCQTAIDFAETLPREEASKRPSDPHFQIGSGV